MSSFASCKFCKRWNTHSVSCQEYSKKNYCINCYNNGHTSAHCTSTNSSSIRFNRILPLLYPEGRYKNHYKNILKIDMSPKLADIPVSETKDICQKCGKKGHKNNECKMCCVCWDKETIYAAIPCGHKKYCLDCIRNLELCAVCRTEINCYVRVYD